MNETAETNNKNELVEPPLFAFLKQYSDTVAGSRAQKFAYPMIIISVVLVAASVFLTIIPGLVMNILVSASGLATVAALHILLSRKDIGPGNIKQSHIRYLMIITATIVLGLFIASQFLPYALGGYLSIIFILNAAFYWLVNDRNKNVAIMASRREAELELERELELDDQEDMDDESPDDEAWNDYLDDRD